MKNTRLWLLWLTMMLISIAYLTHLLVDGDDKTLFMPGEMTAGHHQIGIACDTCHTDSFTDKGEMQKACESCHADQRKKPFDSHPKAKFTDPRNAERLENIDALHCVTCHVEHKPEITQKTGLTQPVDFCVHCHSDIADERPSHAGMAFETCASAGCHNYHNNRALYTDFLVKHMNEPEMLAKQVMPKREFVNVLDDIATYPHDRYPVRQLQENDIEEDDKSQASEKIIHDWVTSSHAAAGVNCSSCHRVKNEQGEIEWNDHPGYQSCQQCHDVEVKHFSQGKHGMRMKAGLDAMTPEKARLPMKKESSSTPLDCNTCHQAHAYKMESVAVDACLDCHNDKHSLAYKASPHFELWQKEQDGSLPQGSGVSCATCHMPRVSIDVSEWLRRVVVQHNQNATLVPNEKMIRPVCMNCHGLAFSIDSLADEKLIGNNFKGKPSVHIKSVDMAAEDHKRHLEETEGE